MPNAAAHAQADAATLADARWDQVLADVAARNDVDGYLRLYDHFAPRLLNFLQLRGASPGQAEDLVQEAMLRLWQQAARFDPRKAQVSTWLFRITRNLHVDAIRAHAARGGSAQELELVEELALEDTQPQPAMVADHVELGRAIAALPPTQARLIRMAYLQGHSHSEIADECQMPLGTVKSTIRRAFLRLQAHMGAPA